VLYALYSVYSCILYALYILTEASRDDARSLYSCIEQCEREVISHYLGPISA